VRAREVGYFYVEEQPKLIAQASVSADLSIGGMYHSLTFTMWRRRGQLSSELEARAKFLSASESEKGATVKSGVHARLPLAEAVANLATYFAKDYRYRLILQTVAEFFTL
jgi:hypothetical protein